MHPASKADGERPHGRGRRGPDPAQRALSGSHLRRPQRPDCLWQDGSQGDGGAARKVRARCHIRGRYRVDEPRRDADPQGDREDPRRHVPLYRLAGQRWRRIGQTDRHHRRGDDQGVRGPRRLHRDQSPGARPLQRRSVVRPVGGALRDSRGHRSGYPQQRGMLSDDPSDHPREVGPQPAPSGAGELPVR